MFEPIKMTVYGNPITKKNHQKICVNHRTGQRFISQSDKYRYYEADFINQCVIRPIEPISEPVELKCIYYLEKKVRGDLLNYEEATADCLVRAGILADDNYKIVASMDGSRIRFDKENPRVEIEIRPYKEGT